MGTELPSGTVTFLLTDVEGSTRLWDAEPEAMAGALARHDALVGDAVRAAGGTLLKTRGEGDSTFSVFDDAAAAVHAILDIQVAMAREAWPASTPLRVRAAVHTGAAELRDGDYFGGAVNRAARLRAVAYGGQVVCSAATTEALGDRLPRAASFLDLGVHRLRDLSRPERISQLCHPDLARDFPPLRTLDRQPHNLPVQLTRFVGRDTDLGEVHRLLLDRRFLTLTGPGGCGKTRLALQAAAEAGAEFAGGVWLVELATIDRPEGIVAAAALAVGVREEPGRTLEEALVAELEPTRALVVLDNCEHLVDACAAFADRLLHACPSVVILATSRQALGVTGETVYALAPLGVPPEDVVDLDRLAAYDSARLFLDRLAEARPGGGLRAGEGESVARLCRRLDGMPLALELAAARVSVLSLNQLADRLDDRFAVLTTGSRTALPRHQTLRATLDWSYDLLGAPEQSLLRSVAVFRGSWPLGGADAVFGGDALGELSMLVDKSLVVAEEGRYRLLETVREYAGERLRAEPDDVVGAVRRRHLQWATENPTDVELADAGAALTWAVTEANAVESGLRLASALAPRWESEGLWSEARTWLSHARTEPADGEAVDPRVRASCLVPLSRLSLFAGDLASAQACAELARDLAGAAGDERLVAASHNQLGNLHHLTGNYDEARRNLEVALASFERLDERRSMVVVINGLAMVAHVQSDFATAQDWYQRALDMARTLEEPYLICAMLQSLATVFRHLGRITEARALLEEALGLVPQVGDRRMGAMLLDGVANLAYQVGDLDEADRRHAECFEAMTALGDSHGVAVSLNGRGWIALMRDEIDDAARFFDAAAPVWASIGSPLGLGASGCASGALEVARKAFTRAAEFFAEAYNHVHQLADPRMMSHWLDEVAIFEVARGDGHAALESFGAAAGCWDRIAGGGRPLPDQDRVDAAESAARTAYGDSAHAVYEAARHGEPDEVYARIAARLVPTA